MQVEKTSLINESTELANSIQLFNNVVLIAPYNFGKESLINYSIQKASKRKKILTLSINMLFSVCEDDFLCKYASMIINSLKNISIDIFESCLRDLSFWEIPYEIEAVGSSADKISVSNSGNKFTAFQQEKILNIPERIAKKYKIRLLICLFEFQSIKSWNKKNLSFIQLFHDITTRHKSVSYCISGSHLYQMKTLFDTKNSILNNFGQVLYLEPLSFNQFSNYIKMSLENEKRLIEADTILRILEVTDGNPGYIELLLTEILNCSKKTVSIEWVEDCIEILIGKYITYFKSDLSKCTENQKFFLIALSKQNEKYLYSSNFIKKSGLKYSSKLDQDKNSLIKANIIYYSKSKRLTFLNPLFKYWLADSF